MKIVSLLINTIPASQRCPTKRVRIILPDNVLLHFKYVTSIPLVFFWYDYFTIYSHKLCCNFALTLNGTITFVSTTTFEQTTESIRSFPTLTINASKAAPSSPRFTLRNPQSFLLQVACCRNNLSSPRPPRADAWHLPGRHSTPYTLRTRRASSNSCRGTAGSRCSTHP